MLTRTVEYAVRATVVLARHYGNGPVSADTIASIVGGPRNYLSKTLNVLARHGILASVRGPGGGFSLAILPDVLTVADIVDVFADVRKSHVRCLLGDVPCDLSAPCSAHHRWMEMTTMAREPLVRTTIGALSRRSTNEEHRPPTTMPPRSTRAGTIPSQELRHEDTLIT